MQRYFNGVLTMGSKQWFDGADMCGFKPTTLQSTAASQGGLLSGQVRVSRQPLLRDDLSSQLCSATADCAPGCDKRTCRCKCAIVTVVTQRVRVFELRGISLAMTCRQQLSRTTIHEQWSYFRNAPMFE